MQWNHFTSQQWTLGGVWTSKEPFVVTLSSLEHLMTHNHPFVHKKLFQYIAWAMPLLYPTLIDADPPDWSHQIHVWFQGQFLAVLDPIGAPWLPRWPTWPTKLFLCITTDAQWLLPPLFHTVPPDPLMAKKGRFWPHWTLDVPFDAPGWPPLTHKTVAKHHPGCALACSITLIPNCFTIL